MAKRLNYNTTQWVNNTQLSSPLFLFILLTIKTNNQVGAQSEMRLQCPILTCDGQNLNEGECFLHDGKASSREITGGVCFDAETAREIDIPYVCPFNLEEYMWVDMKLQGQSDNERTMKYKNTSQLEKRKKKGLCVEAASLRKEFNPGRTCETSGQCKSRLCLNGFCLGKPVGAACHKHEDCVEGAYCTDLNYFPFQSVCADYRNNLEQCEEDFQCKITHYCWYHTAADKSKGIKRCMESYSQDDGTTLGWSGKSTLDDYTANGKYCKSGLAFRSGENEGKCVSADEIRFDGEKTEYPYQCVPNDPNKKCQIVYNKDTSEEGFLEVDCSCALNEDAEEKLADVPFKQREDLGYCASVIGTETFNKAKRAKKLVYERSKCHTLDREDWRAQRDECGIESHNDEWRFALDQQFNVTHWPYVQRHETYHCVQKFFADSYINLSLNGGACAGITFFSATSALVLGALLTS